MEEHIYPNERVFEKQLNKQADFWAVVPPIIKELKLMARNASLWNLFLSDWKYGASLTNLEYAPVDGIMERSLIAPEVFNCNALGMGNMEVLVQYCSEEKKKEWLKPVLAGEICTWFAMAKPDVASNDATNIRSSIVRNGNGYVISGTRW